MENTQALYFTAATVAALHTLLGPDHYLPFVAMSRAGSWSRSKTLVVTLLCGVGHVVGSVAIGALGIAMGAGLFRLESLQRFRGDVAGWLMIAFGLAYFLWGMRRAVRNKPHTHLHVHADGTVHAHKHTHGRDHMHVHHASGAATDHGAGRMTPWVLFTVFLFGPCEPLIPVLMYPAAGGDVWAIVAVTLIFTVVTLGTMVVAVWVGCVMAERTGRLTPRLFAPAARYAYAIAGFVVMSCGVAIQAGL